MTARQFPPWRSLLYVPAHQPTFVARAAERGADALILDLEDGVPPAAKDVARDLLGESVRHLQDQGAEILVRVNQPWALAWRDLEAVVAAGVGTVVLPKAADTARLRVIDAFLRELEGVARPIRPVELLLILESARGVVRAPQLLACSRRIVGVIPGNEDLATDLGVEPLPELFVHTHVPIILAARACNVALVGFIGSSGNFRDLAGYRERAQLARRWGFQGATCVHPAQIEVLNEVFAPTDDEVQWARQVVAVFEAAGGAPTQLDGQMVDLPVYLRAQNILARQGRKS